MGVTSTAGRCLTPVLLATLLSGCSSTATQPEPRPAAAAQSGVAPERVDQIELVTGATSRVISLEEFVALQEIENMGPLDPGEKLICRKERVVGTHFRSYRCFKEGDLYEIMQASQDWLRAAQYWQQQKAR